MEFLYILDFLLLEEPLLIFEKKKNKLQINNSQTGCYQPLKFLDVRYEPNFSNVTSDLI